MGLGVVNRNHMHSCLLAINFKQHYEVSYLFPTFTSIHQLIHAFVYYIKCVTDFLTDHKLYYYNFHVSLLTGFI